MYVVLILDDSHREAQTLGSQASVVAAHELGSYGVWAPGCELQQLPQRGSVVMAVGLWNV